MANRTDAFNALLPLVEGKPMAMAHLGRLLQADGQAQRAVDLCLRALQLSPDDGELGAVVGGVLSTNVPRWHFNIVRDADRNRSYESALARAMTPGCRVLEIGAGSGLLAMMAARAGAAAVYTCEANPVVARMAQQIVAANGYADRVHVIGGHSTDLDADRDLGGRADLLVSEIFSNNMIGEGGLPVLEDAWRRLLTPAARVIPARGRVVVALAEDQLRDQRRMDVVAGFDLSTFNLAERPSYALSVGAPRLTLRSAPKELFSFEFQDARAWPAGQASVALVGEGAAINGVAQWIALDLDAETTYENRPGAGATSCWAVMFHPFASQLVAAERETVVVRGRHDRHGLHLWTSATARAGAPQ